MSRLQMKRRSEATRVLVRVSATAEAPPRFEMQELARKVASPALCTLDWTRDDFRVIAGESLDYASGWCTVADADDNVYVDEVVKVADRTWTLFELVRSVIDEKRWHSRLSMDAIRIASQGALAGLYGRK